MRKRLQSVDRRRATRQRKRSILRATMLRRIANGYLTGVVENVRGPQRERVARVKLAKRGWTVHVWLKRA